MGFSSGNLVCRVCNLRFFLEEGILLFECVLNVLGTCADHIFQTKSSFPDYLISTSIPKLEYSCAFGSTFSESSFIKGKRPLTQGVLQKPQVGGLKCVPSAVCQEIAFVTGSCLVPKAQTWKYNRLLK